MSSSSLYCSVWHSFCLFSYSRAYLSQVKVWFEEWWVSNQIQSKEKENRVREGVWSGVFSVSLDFPSPLIVFGWTLTTLQTKPLLTCSTVGKRAKGMPDTTVETTAQVQMSGRSITVDKGTLFTFVNDVMQRGGEGECRFVIIQHYAQAWLGYRRG